MSQKKTAIAILTFTLIAFTTVTAVEGASRGGGRSGGRSGGGRSGRSAHTGSRTAGKAARSMHGSGRFVRGGSKSVRTIRGGKSSFGSFAKHKSSVRRPNLLPPAVRRPPFLPPGIKTKLPLVFWYGKYWMFKFNKGKLVLIDESGETCDDLPAEFTADSTTDGTPESTCEACGAGEVSCCEELRSMANRTLLEFAELRKQVALLQRSLDEVRGKTAAENASDGSDR